MSRKRETRSAQIRAAQVDGKPGVTLHIIRPGVVDDYGTLWAADAFDEALRERLPALTWSHQWSEPLGPGVGFRTGPDGPEVDFVFSDFEAVPPARRAHAQVSDGTITDCSVGFYNADRREPTDEERKRFPGVREVISRAGLDEVALVLRGAVPGAKVLAVRSADVDFDAFLEIAKRKSAGELTDEQARAAVELLGVEAPAGDGATSPEGAPPAVPDEAAVAAQDAELDAALELIGRSAAR